MTLAARDMLAFSIHGARHKFDALLSASSIQRSKINLVYLPVSVYRLSIPAGSHSNSARSLHVLGLKFTAMNASCLAILILHCAGKTVRPTYPPVSF